MDGPGEGSQDGGDQGSLAGGDLGGRQAEEGGPSGPGREEAWGPLEAAVTSPLMPRAPWGAEY